MTRKIAAQLTNGSPVTLTPKNVTLLVTSTALGSSAAAVVDASERVTGEGRSANDWTIALNRTAEGDVYPIVLLAYAIACQKYTDAATAEKVKAYLGYIASAEGQQAAAKAAGSAPLSEKLSADVEAATATIS